jgi:hypothetical protein
MKQPADDLHGGFEISLTPMDAERKLPPRLGPLPDGLRPHVEAVLGDMQKPTPIELTLGYYSDEELENFGTVTFSEADGSRFGFGVETNAREVDLLIALAEGLQENFPELDGAWAQARPACPGHTHPATPHELDGVAWWTCPQDGRPITPIGTLASLR